MTTPEDTGALSSIAQALTQIDETLRSILTLMQEREAAFKERKSFDRKPPFRKSFDRDGDRDDRPPRRAPRRDDGDEGYAPRRKPSFRDDGDRGSKFGAPRKKPFGAPRGSDKPAPRRKSVRFEE